MARRGEVRPTCWSTPPADLLGKAWPTPPLHAPEQVTGAWVRHCPIKAAPSPPNSFMPPTYTPKPGVSCGHPEQPWSLQRGRRIKPPPSRHPRHPHHKFPAATCVDCRPVWWRSSVAPRAAAPPSMMLPPLRPHGPCTAWRGRGRRHQEGSAAARREPGCADYSNDGGSGESFARGE